MNTRLAALTMIAGAAVTASFSLAQNAQPPVPPAPPAPPAAAPVTLQPAPGTMPQIGVAPKQTTIFQPPPPTTPHFDPLWTKGADGKIVPLSGVLEARAIMNNPLMDSAAREKARAAAEDWQADVNQLAVDNLDFLEKIDEGGLIDKLDFNNSDEVRYISQIMVPFMSTGPLSTRLQNKGAMSGEQANVNQIIVNDYLQKIFEEIMGTGGIDPIRAEEPPETQKQKIDKINTLTHFLYYTTCRDARESYHQIMIDSASMTDGIIGSMQLSAADAAKVKPAVAAVHSAKTDADKNEKVRALLKNFNFDQRRQYLQKAVDMGAAKNPLDAVAGPGPRAEGPEAPVAVPC